MLTLGIPGAGVLAVLRAPARFCVLASPAVSMGLVTLTVLWTTMTGAPWGWGPVAGTTVVALALCLVLRRLRARRGEGRSRCQPATSARPAASVVPGWVLGAAAVVASIGTLGVLLAGIPRPDSLQQSHDAPFHVNALAAVLAQSDAGWDVVGAVAAPGATSSFYPSGLHALAALVAQASGQHPVIVLNVVMAALCGVVWPAGMVLLTGVATGDRFAVGAVSLLAPVTLLFPTLLLHFGVLWPNAAGLALAPGVLALLAAVRMRDSTPACEPLTTPLCASPLRASADTSDRDLDGRLSTGASASLSTSTSTGERPGAGADAPVAAAALGVCGVALTHPSALLSVVSLVAPLVVVRLVEARRALVDPRARRRLVGTAAVAITLSLVGLGLVVTSPPGRSLLGSRSRTVTDAGTALGEVLTMGSHLTAGWLVLAALALVGAVHGARRGLGWVVTGWAIVAASYVVAASVEQGKVSALLALWDREPYRVVAPLAIPGLVLGGHGASVLVHAMSGAAARRRRPGPRTARALAVGLTVLVIASGWPSGASSVARLVGRNYGDQAWWRTVVSEREARTYERVLGPRRDGRAVAGDPFGGGQWAGVLSGHPSVFTHFGHVPTADTDLLRRHLREMTPEVCAAIRRLDVGYVVEDTDTVWDNDPRHGAYSGLHGLAGVRGLRQIGHDGTVTVWEVTGCAMG